ncbi:CD44 antigen isoform X24 [Coturnix japonica]|uniref:CD44 antigen isoform X24 n=1 Tax=Coturnix japonica TaxID=93934 RepID=UPI000777A5E2|nr:CD44 antigen isoform X24 [Coturnix japonica]
MANFYLWAAFGLCLLKLCLTETQFNVSCRYGGVFHVEKNGRYSLTRTEAIELCRALNSTLATLEQFERAHELGFETCRYGFIVGHIVIPRINPYHLCAANHTGVYKLSSNTTGRYDAYCYNETESRIKACEPIERIDTSFLSNQSEIVIDNEDGSRYNADGTRHSGDSSTSGVDDENLGSGSIHDTTPGDTSIRRSSPSYYGSVTPISHMPDHSSGGGEKDFPVKQYDDEISPTSTDISATATDFHKEDDVQHPASTITVSVNVFHPEEGTSRPLVPSIQPGSDSEQANATDGSHVNLIPGVFPDMDDHLYQLPSHLSTTLDTPDDASHEEPTQPTLPSDNEAARSTEGITHPTDAPGIPVLLGLDPASANEADEESLLMSTTIITTVTDSNDVLNPEDVTREVWTPRVIDTALATPDNGHHEEATQATLPSDNEAAQSTEGITHTTDAPGDPVLLGLDPASTDEAGEESLLTSTTVTVSVNVFHPEEGTNRPLIPSIQPGSDSEQANATDGSHVNLIPGVFPDMDDHLYQLPTPPPPRSTSNINSDQGPYQEDGEPTPFPGESTTTTVTSQPRSAQVPEWLIIVAALLALALILAVCIAVNSRRRCGQKKKLVINNGKGAVEDRKTRELNGDASKSQEMVHLVHKEQSNDQTGACDEFLTVDETQNHQDVDMKSGV